MLYLEACSNGLSLLRATRTSASLSNRVARGSLNPLNLPQPPSTKLHFSHFRSSATF